MFIEKLNKRIDAVDSMLCVGLDPDLKRLPAHLTKDAEGVLQFCCAIVDATAPYVCAFKPQIAYFAGEGLEKRLNRSLHTFTKSTPTLPSFSMPSAATSAPRPNSTPRKPSCATKPTP